MIGGGGTQIIARTIPYQPVSETGFMKLRVWFNLINFSCCWIRIKVFVETNNTKVKTKGYVER